MDLLYFDHAATTPVKDEVIKEMLPYFSNNYGNASSIYSIGRRSKKALDTARTRVAKAIAFLLGKLENKCNSLVLEQTLQKLYCMQ